MDIDVDRCLARKTGLDNKLLEDTSSAVWPPAPICALVARLIDIDVDTYMHTYKQRQIDR